MVSRPRLVPMPEGQSLPCSDEASSIPWREQHVPASGFYDQPAGDFRLLQSLCDRPASILQ